MKKELHPALKIWLPVLIVLVLSMVVAMRFAEKPPPKRLVIATGGPTGAYFAFGNEYKARFAQSAPGIDFEVRATDGSIENIRLLESGEVDLAFIQGGTAGAASEDTDIQAIASVYYEPIWVFYHSEEPLGLLSELALKEIAVGPEGSGTWPVARQLLEINSVTSENASLHHHGSAAAKDKLLAGEVDAAFFIASPQAPVIRELVDAAASYAQARVDAEEAGEALGEDAPPPIRLLNFRRYRAYARRLPFLKELTIPEGLIDMERNIPSEEIVLLATTATLCAREGLHSGVAQLLAKIAIDTHGGPSVMADRGEFPTEKFVEFPMNLTARDYLVNGPSWLNRTLPFWASALVGRLKILLLPLLTLFIPLLKFAPILYKVGINRRIYKWYKTLGRVEGGLERESLTAEQLEGALGELQEVADEVAQLSVPVGYRKEVYNLRLHINFVMEQIKKRRLGGGEGADGEGASGEGERKAD